MFNPYGLALCIGTSASTLAALRLSEDPIVGVCCGVVFGVLVTSILVK